MTDHQAINDLTASLIRSVGIEVESMSELAPKMVCIEGLVAALIFHIAAQHNKQPDELVEVFCEGVRECVTRLVYGRKQ
jgi:hypothetical protein